VDAVLFDTEINYFTAGSSCQSPDVSRKTLNWRAACWLGAAS
jgi:hypothetical protein